MLLCQCVIVLLCYLVIEVLNLLPFDPLLRILFLEETKIIEITLIIFILVICFSEFLRNNKSLVSHLLSLHCQLNEDLLKLLVDKVDAELLEAVLLEDLEAVDVEDADAQHLLLRLVLHRLVHPHHQVVKQPDDDDDDLDDNQGEG